MKWWEQIEAGPTGRTAPARSGPSLYESRYSRAGRGEDVKWTPVGELDPRSGRWTVAPEPDWGRAGWTPFGEWASNGGAKR